MEHEGYSAQVRAAYIGRSDILTPSSADFLGAVGREIGYRLDPRVTRG